MATITDKLSVDGPYTVDGVTVVGSDQVDVLRCERSDVKDARRDAEIIAELLNDCRSTNDEEIKSCPCCGGSADFKYNEWNAETEEGDDGTGWITCSKCGLQSKTEDMDSAIESWNRRTQRLS